MNLKMYLNALKLYEEGKVNLDKETDNRMYFTVNDYIVIIGKDGFASCTCMHGSLKPKQLCKHIIASILKILYG